MSFIKIFITAIGTDSGKTLIAAILTEALKADYWKPIQAGYPRDAETVKGLVSNSVSKFHTERHLLMYPMSPHAAAEKENIQIRLHDFELPTPNNHLIVEGAGGMLVPINDEHFVIDLVDALSLPMVLVSNLYLGSINHTLLSIQEIKRRGLNCKGIIFNGEANEASEKIILKHSPFPLLFRVPRFEKINAEVVAEFASEIRPSLENLLLK
ncbi:MAG: dethiobiotin synthase [Flammeovirgaceae bacterium]